MLAKRAGLLPCVYVSTCTTSRLCRLASGWTLTDLYAPSSSTELTCPIGIPGGYNESSGLATVPDVTTYSPLVAEVLAGRYCSTRSFGSPTLGCTTPVAPVPLIRAETPTSLSVIRSTTEPSEVACATFPTR